MMGYSWSKIVSFTVLIVLMAVSMRIRSPIRGYWCDDHTIRYPHMDMVVDFRLLLFVSVALPVAFFKLLPVSIPNNVKYYGSRQPVQDYLFGYIINLLLTCYCKVTIGRLRPNFYEICRPTVGCSVDEHKFIPSFDCTTPRFLSHNSTESFFSGHASMGIYVAISMIFHLCNHWRAPYISKATICFILFCIGLFPGLTQVLNHWHHWSDVLTGHLVGCVLGCLQFYARHLFEDHHPHQTKGPIKSS